MSPTIRLLKETCGREPLLIGSRKLRRLAAFLRGYRHAARELAGVQYDFLRRFQDLVQRKYRVEISQSWEEIISFHCASDDEVLARFWQEFDAFLAANPERNPDGAMTTIGLLQRIRGREAMFVGVRNINRIAVYLAGCRHAIAELGGVRSDTFLQRFQDHIQKKYGVVLSKGWDEIIRFQCASDEEAVVRFWNDLDEFVNANPDLAPQDEGPQSPSLG